MIISVCGVPASGKTTIAKKLSEKLDFEYIDLNKIIIENKLYDNYDEFYSSYIVDEEKLRNFMKDFFKKDKNYVVDGILSYLIDADIYIVLRVDPNILKERLEKRGYSFHKIFENIWAMNMEIIEGELEENGKIFYVFYNNKEEDLERIVNDILKIINKSQIP